MNLNMQVSASINSAEPEHKYYAELEHSALRTLGTSVDEFEQAYVLCEYLDCVDSGAWPSAPALYRRCVASLCTYLERCARSQAHALANKSWAAHTILDIFKRSKLGAGTNSEPVAIDPQPGQARLVEQSN